MRPSSTESGNELQLHSNYSDEADEDQERDKHADSET